MEQTIDKWQSMPDGIPNGDSICYLIEMSNEGEQNEK